MKRQRKKKYKMKCVICNANFESNMEHASTCSTKCRQRLFVSGFHSKDLKTKLLIAKKELMQDYITQCKFKPSNTFFIDENDYVHAFIFNPAFLKIRKQYFKNE